MIHEQPTTEVQERAALYALGALPPEEAAAFEAHLAEGCRVCEAEALAGRDVTRQLGYATPWQDPPRQVQDRLGRIVAGFARGDWLVVRSAEGQWAPGPAEGVGLRRLSEDPAARRVTALVRMAPRACYPSHRHTGTEELYLLEGDLSIQGARLGVGDYCAARASTTHGEARTEAGCLFLLHAAREDRLTPHADASATGPGLVLVRSSDGIWRAGPAAGVEHRLLLADPAAGTQTYLVRMRPGARLPGHRHAVAEQFLMLDGDGHVTGQVLRAGDYYRAAAGTTHEATYSEGGCTFLVLASRAETLA